MRKAFVPIDLVVATVELICPRCLSLGGADICLREREFGTLPVLRRLRHVQAEIMAAKACRVARAMRDVWRAAPCQKDGPETTDNARREGTKE
jgi:hypothetical protein